MSNDNLTKGQLVLTLVASVAASVAVSTLLSSQLNKLSFANTIFGNKHNKPSKGTEKSNNTEKRKERHCQRSDSEDCTGSDCSSESTHTNTNNVVAVQHHFLHNSRKQSKEHLLKQHHTTDTTPMRTASPEWHSPHGCEDNNCECEYDEKELDFKKHHHHHHQNNNCMRNGSSNRSKNRSASPKLALASLHCTHKSQEIYYNNNNNDFVYTTTNPERFELHHNASCKNTGEARDMSRILSYRSVHSPQLEHASSLRFLTNNHNNHYCSSISKSNKNGSSSNNIRTVLDGDVNYNKSDLPICSPILHPECIIPSLPSVPIYRIVITGGPCSGKSTCLSYLKKELEESLHFKVYCVPEVATLLMLGGIKLWRDEADASFEAAEQLKQEAIDDAMTEFEKTLLSMQEFRQELTHVRDELLLRDSEDVSDDEEEEESVDDNNESRETSQEEESEREIKESTTEKAKLNNGKVLRNGGKDKESKHKKGNKRNVKESEEQESSESSSSSSSSQTLKEKEEEQKQTKQSKNKKSKKSKATESLSRIRIITQRIVLEMMLKLEDAFAELASLRHEPAVILCDRGTMDGSAYCSTKEWNAIVSLLHCSDAELRDGRYDAVIHFVTAALGAEPYYTLANNATRRETLSEAIAMDFNTRNAWRGHYLMYVVDNSTNFEMKLQRAAQFIRKLVGVDENVIIENNCNNNDNNNNPLCPSMDTTPLSPPLHLSLTNDVIHVNENKNSKKINSNEHEVQELAFLMTGNRCCRSLSSLRVSRARSEYQHTSPLLSYLHNHETNTINANEKDKSTSEEKDSVRLSTNTNSSNDETSKIVEIEPEPRNPEEGIHHANGPESNHPNNIIIIGDNNNNNALSTRVMSSWEEGALVGVQRHFIVTHVDQSHIPHNAVRAEITIIFLKPTQREFVSEMIIRRVSLPHLKTYNDNTNTFHGVEENNHKGKPKQHHHKIDCKSNSALINNNNSNNKACFHEDMDELPHENSEGEHIYIRRVEYENLQIDNFIKNNINDSNNDSNSTSPNRHKRLSARNVCTRLISKEVFLQLSRHYDPLQPLVQKYTTRFVHELQHFTLVAFRKPAALNGVVRLIAPADMSIDQLPSWITVDESISMTNNDVIM